MKHKGFKINFKVKKTNLHCPFFYENIQAKQHCKIAKHLSLTAESDPLFYIFSFILGHMIRGVTTIIIAATNFIFCAYNGINGKK